MSDNWDDDDYDPDAQLAAQASDKLATLGLDEVIRQQQKPANSLPQTEDVQPSVANKKTQGGLNKNEHDSDLELTEKQKREAQLKSDAAAAMDLFGISVERKESTIEDLQTKADFQSYADKLSEQISSRQSSAHYLFFVNYLVDQLTKQMNKVQLQTIKDTVQTHLDVYIKHEEEQQKRKQDQQNQKEKQKTKKKQVREDLVEGEYDDYDERYNPY